MIKILLADDHLIIRDGIKLLLKKHKTIKVIAEAGNGKEVIDYLHYNSHEIDVVLMDISMPEMNGIETTRIISERFPRVKVLGLTMHEEESYIMSMLESGAMGYVLKDSGVNELIAAIKAVNIGEKYFSREASVTLINAFMIPERPKPIELSARERKVISLVSKGLTNNEIGIKLGISSRTIESHRRNILRKLNLRNTAEMVRFAIENHLT